MRQSEYLIAFGAPSPENYIGATLSPSSKVLVAVNDLRPGVIVPDRPAGSTGRPPLR